MICYIVGAGEGDADFTAKEQDFIIAADGGVKKLEEKGITADLIIGDFDSLGYIPDEENIIKLPVEKDDTDLQAAAKEGIKRGYKQFSLYGVLGGRLDHTFAAVQTMTGLKKQGCNVWAYGYNTAVSIIRNEKISIAREQFHYFSLFSLDGKSTGVSITGAHYELKDATLEYGFPLGCSNQFENDIVEVEVKDGTILIILTGIF